MYQQFGKRTLDLTIASVALIILALPMIVVALWVKLDSKGPILFKQLRSGRNRVPFLVYKFRTMSTDAPSDAPTNEFKNAGSFITGSGKIMRKLSLDELPQLFNVVKGDMSIVGPRPVVLKETNLLKLRAAVGANDVKPGITGWAQVNGRDELTPGEKAELDGFYAERVSLIFDTKCVAMTAWIVLAAKGNKEGYELDDQVSSDVTPIDPQLVSNES